MMKYALAAFAALAFAAATPAFAAPLVSNVYVHADAGMVLDARAGDIQLANSASFGAGAGAQVGPFRLDISANQHEADLNLGSLVVQGRARDYRANLYYDFHLSDRDALFVGGGVDRFNVEANFLNARRSADSWGWNVAGGMSHRLSDHMVMQAQVTYLKPNNVDFGCGDANIQGITATAGLRINL